MSGAGGGGVEAELRILEPLCAVFRRALSAAKLKYTPERALILDTVMRMPEPFQAEELIDRLRRAGSPGSKATVYRTIKLLAEAGIIQQVLLDAEQAHYVLAYGRGSSAVLVRAGSREVELVDLPEVAAVCARVCAARGLEAQGHRLVIYAREPESPGATGRHGAQPGG